MNLGEVKENLGDLMARSDYTEAKKNLHVDRAIRRIQRVANLPNMEKVVKIPITSSGPVIPIPSDYMSMVHFLNGKYAYEKVDYERLIDLDHGYLTHQGGFHYYSRIRDTWILAPAFEGDVITLVYHAAWPVMTSDTDTNSILEQAPELVIYAAAQYAAIYFIDQRAQSFENEYLKLAEDLKLQQWNMEISSSSAQTVDPVVHPDRFYGGY